MNSLKTLGSLLMVHHEKPLLRRKKGGLEGGLEIGKNRVNPQITRPSFGGQSQNTAYLRRGSKSAFDIMGVEGGQSLPDAHLET